MKHWKPLMTALAAIVTLNAAYALPENFEARLKEAN